MVDRESRIPSIEKFQYLRGCLVDAAMGTIRSLEQVESYIRDGNAGTQLCLT